MAQETNLRFQVGDHVVYPLQGVGVVKAIKERVVRNTPVMCYVIYIDVSDITVSIPIEKIDDAGVRPIVGEEDAKKALESISSKYEPISVDWKQRYQMNVDLVKEGSISSIAKVVQGLYHRSKVKELPVQERKLYDNAIRLLIDECSYSLGKEKNEIEKTIFSHLEKEK
ncbi:MAG: CarD family transcriptional regulator [Sphaerochaetaceae bacterium]|nr:CarD family transcriptional regulator [Sphaerochaetaceae bacterium]